jgi:Dyp-type peroxidase family
MSAPDFADVQGIVRRGYGDMAHACFLLLEVLDGAAARRWVATLADQVTNALVKPPEGRLNVAFSHAGLEALGLSRATLDGFSREFREGMTTPRRSRILGDEGDNAPERWAWGGPDHRAVHAALLLYAPSATRMDQLRGFHRARLEAIGLAVIRPLDTLRLPLRKEHFGFRDGIGQPEMEGLDKGGPPANVVAAGEFLLGYPNESGGLTAHPGPFALNGSYLVLRQMEQHVTRFWTFVDRATRRTGGDADADERVRLAAKMVGRWPSGAPLVGNPERDPHAGVAEEDLPPDAEQDRFGYHEADPDGYVCPLGAHVRRTNPRDGLPPSPRISSRFSNLRRIIRRGRAYGPPVAASMKPEDILAAPDPGGERGLHFLCFCADLSLQFEFIQQNWVSNPKVGGLYADPDPLIGAQDPRHPEYGDTFTAPGRPIRQRVRGLEPFVTIRGGAYLFLPGVRGVRMLGET